MQFYDTTILIFGLSERDGLILDQCGPVENASKKVCRIWKKVYDSVDALNKLEK